MTRLEANREILKILSEQIEKQPNVRFWQLLSNLQVVKSEKEFLPGEASKAPDGSYYSTLFFTIKILDEFYLESEPLLSRIKEHLND
jgi:hypothetical protein